MPIFPNAVAEAVAMSGLFDRIYSFNLETAFSSCLEPRVLMILTFILSLTADNFSRKRTLTGSSEILSKMYRAVSNSSGSSNKEDTGSADESLAITLKYFPITRLDATVASESRNETSDCSMRDK